MSNVQWFKIRSWHIASSAVSRSSVPLSICGRWGSLENGVVAPVVENRPANEKTCESCLRIAGPH